jgi:hypothetical protein
VLWSGHRTIFKFIAKAKSIRKLGGCCALARGLAGASVLISPANLVNQADSPYYYFDPIE